MCGYEHQEVVGQNCRFLVDPVPADQLDPYARKHAKEFCKAAMLGCNYKIPLSERKPWTPKGDTGGEVLLMQKNARKDGSLFNNLFYMQVLELGVEFGDEVPYIIAFQTELKGGEEDLARIWEHFKELESRMAKVKDELSSLFFMQCAMSRGKSPGRAPFRTNSNGSIGSTLTGSTLTSSTPTGSTRSGESTELSLPSPVALAEVAAVLLTQPPTSDEELCSLFDPRDVKPWKSGRFKHVRKLSEAPRNQGSVHLYKDPATNELFAVKKMPNSWITDSHEDFMEAQPRETELPWLDISCMHYLTSVNCKYACALEGVYRNQDSIFVASAFASHGDLFDIALDGLDPGKERETNFGPLVVQLCSGMKELHSRGIAHRDLSLENVLLAQNKVGEFEIKIIDFGMSSTQRICNRCVRGKQSYQAPEMHIKDEFDYFHSDVFSAGVIVFALVVKDYPWQATRPGVCKHWGYAASRGFKAYCAKRKVRTMPGKKVKEVVSEPLMELLEGMLAFDPMFRLTFGEEDFPGRRSVWDEPWVKEHQDSPLLLLNAGVPSPDKP
jgi:hypothetical protein